jgi:ribonuclease PH
MSVRASGRLADELRRLRITRHYTKRAEGSVLIEGHRKRRSRDRQQGRAAAHA